LGTDHTVLSWIAYGLPWAMHSEPQPYAFEDSPSAIEHADFLKDKAIKHIGNGNYYFPPEGFAKTIIPMTIDEKIMPDGSIKLRGCHNAQYVNAHLADMKHKFQSLPKDIPDIVKQFDDMFSIDVEQAYYCLLMSKEALPWLCFRKNGITIGSRVLLFGVKPASFWFTKVNQPLIRFLRALLIRLLNYIDDWLFSENPELFPQLVFFILNVFRLLGWSLNDKKCCLGRSKIILMLGVLVNSTLCTFEIPPNKASRAKAFVTSMAFDYRNGNPISNSTLRRVTGYITSLKIACPPVMMWLRPAFACIIPSKKRGQHRHTPVKLTAAALESLLEIPQVLQDHGSTKFCYYAPDVHLFTDASESAVGGFFRTSLGVTSSDAAPLPTGLIGKSSTRREMHGVEDQLYRHVDKMAFIISRPT
jgi:hypothetical protein